MFPWLFNIYIHGVVREVNSAKQQGMALTSDGEWRFNQILDADDTVLVADEECKFQRLVSEFGGVR
jgi:hypothetical protein